MLLRRIDTLRVVAQLRDIIRFSRIATNGIHLHVAEAGPSDGPLVVLLHGFPEFWYGWRNQIGCKDWPDKQLRCFFDRGHIVSYIRSAEGVRLAG